MIFFLKKKIKKGGGLPVIQLLGCRVDSSPGHWILQPNDFTHGIVDTQYTIRLLITYKYYKHYFYKYVDTCEPKSCLSMYNVS